MQYTAQNQKAVSFLLAFFSHFSFFINFDCLFMTRCSTKQLARDGATHGSKNSQLFLNEQISIGILPLTLTFPPLTTKHLYIYCIAPV